MLSLFAFYTAYAETPAPKQTNKPRSTPKTAQIRHSIQKSKAPVANPSPIPKVNWDIKVLKNESLNPLPKETTFFRLWQSGKELYLLFQSRDPKLQLNTKESLIIQLFATPPMEVSPRLIFGKDWPSSNKVLLKVAKVNPKRDNTIDLSAVYTYCHETTKVCKQGTTKYSFKYFQQ